jgi:hypothetical protein
MQHLPQLSAAVRLKKGGGSAVMNNPHAFAKLQARMALIKAFLDAEL